VLASAESQLEVRILGRLEVRAHNDSVTVPRRRLARVLLGVLALRPNTPSPLDWIIDVLWHGTPPRSAAANVRSHVAELRRLLRAGSLGCAGAGPRIESADGRYTLVAAPPSLDALRFDAYFANGQRALAAGRPEVAADQLRRACELWRGPLLDGTNIPIALASAAATLEDLRLDALESYVEARLALGRHAELVAELTGLTAAYGLRERLWRQLMRALWHSGRPAEALTGYQRLTELLTRELQTVPSPSTRNLAERIRRGEPAIRTAPPVVVRDSGPWQLPANIGGFVGRRAELAALDPQPAGPGCRIVTGTAGVGKTALVVHWAHRRAAGWFPDGCLYIDLNGYGPREPTPPTRALLDLLRGLGAGPPPFAGNLDHLAARYRSLLADRRMLVVLDNARSAEQVRPLLPGAAGCAAMVTSRDSLAGLVARDGAQRVSVQPLPPDAATELLTGLVGARAGDEPEAVAKLVEHCAGLPLALRLTAELAGGRPPGGLADLADELADETELLDTLDAGGDSGTAVRAVLSWSYRTLTPPVARAFRLIGRRPDQDIDARTLAAAAGIPVWEAARALAVLGTAHLVTRLPGDRWNMSRLLRAYARETVEP
jgi:DNA-binding SARP family transcriptional activator